MTSNRQRAASLAAWSTAALLGEVSAEEAMDSIEVDGELRFVPTVDPDTQSFLEVLARWRRDARTGWQYVLCAPGDAAGIPGPTATAPAINAGAAIVSVDAMPAVWVPEAGNVWREFAAERHGLGLTETAAEAERHLLEQINETVDTLTTLEVARWDGPDNNVTTSATAVGGRPPTMEARSVRLASRSAQVLHVVESVISESGGARSASETQQRAEALRSVERAARRAHAVAWNAGLGASQNRR
jgi:hypothetical protein